MPVDWRRKDTIYAAATVVAMALVAFLVAGNFGLIPSPLAPADLGRAPRVRVAQAAARPLATPPADALPATTATPEATTAAAATPRDRTPPTAAFTTSDGVEAPLTAHATVAGTAEDDESGVDRVAVSFQSSSGGTTTTAATLECDTARTQCTWSADVPDVAGRYTVTARANDRTGNASSAGPITVTVVDAGGVLDDLLGPIVALLG